MTQAALAHGLVELCRLREASSVHVTFMTEAEWQALGARGFLMRTDQQFHWDNAGFATFDDFLAALSSRKRKVIRRERRDALANGIEVEWLTGRDLTEAAWDAFFAFYMDTGSRKWGRPYLTREFFSLIGETMADEIVLIMARRDGRFIAGAINFIGAGTLFGRHWGAVEHHPFLHFEVCYYQAIEFAIARRLQPRRGRRPGRAQARPRLSAEHDLFGALHRRPRVCGAPSTIISSASAPMWRPPAANCARRARSAKSMPTRNRQGRTQGSEPRGRNSGT